MGREELIINERLKKIDELRKQGINPYPAEFDKKNSAAELQEKYKNLGNEEYGKAASIAGRIIAIRNFGKISFVKLQDYSGNIQVVLKEGETKKQIIDFFNRFIDIGDFIGVKGKIFRTKRGELSVIAAEIKLLAKSIKPIPAKYHGLRDKEERYR